MFDNMLRALHVPTPIPTQPISIPKRQDLDLQDLLNAMFNFHRKVFTSPSPALSLLQHFTSTTHWKPFPEFIKTFGHFS
jgi:hypothetical protein